MNQLQLFKYISSSVMPFSPKFKVPHTLIYENYQIQAWAFSDGLNTVRRKLRKNITADNIRQAFQRHSERTGVLAYIVLDKASDIEADFLLPSEGKKIIYLSAQQFEHLLSGTIRLKRGLVQKFRDIVECQQATIQVVWTRYLTTFIRYTNKSYLASAADTYEKCCTFDGPEYFSESCSLKGVIALLLKQQVELIVRRIEDLTCNSMTCKSLIVYFKRSANGDLHFLFPSTINQDSDQRIREIPKVAIPQEVNVQTSKSSSRRKFRCMFCAQYQDQPVSKLVCGRHEQRQLLAELFKSEAAFDQSKVCENCFLQAAAGHTLGRQQEWVSKQLKPVSDMQNCQTKESSLKKPVQVKQRRTVSMHAKTRGFMSEGVFKLKETSPEQRKSFLNSKQKRKTLFSSKAKLQKASPQQHKMFLSSKIRLLKESLPAFELGKLARLQKILDQTD